MLNIRNKFYNALILCLLSVIAIECSYIFFSSFIIKRRLAYSIIPPSKSNKVSPLTGNLLNSDRRNPLQIIFSPKEISEPISGINNADLIFEYINECGKSAYNAIFYDNVPAKASPIKKIEDIPIKQLPQLSFTQNVRDVYKGKKDATYIFITLNQDLSSNFIFENGLYKHFKDNSMDIDAETFQPVLVSNVLVQYTNNYGGIENINELGAGTGMLFCGGRIIDIQWKNDGTSPIKIEDESGDPVLLQNGKTWWVIINKNYPVSFN